MLPALDISKYQGAWQDRGDPIVMIKMSGGDDGLYMDPDAAANYTGATGDERSVGGYHFIGWTMGAVAEASFFLQAMSPLAENDVYALDVEAIPAGVDPVAYTLQMVQYIHDKIGVWCLVYMSLSVLNEHDWSAVLANSGLWLADWSVAPTANIPTTATYVMQQYSDGPGYDHDEWFGTVAEFQAYGWHAAVAPIPPAPVIPPVTTMPGGTIVTPTTPTGDNNNPIVGSPANPPTTAPTVPKPNAPTTTAPIKRSKFNFWGFLISLFKRKG